MDRSKWRRAIEQLAYGAVSRETSYEYGLDEEGNLRPVRKKETIKEEAPDFRAIQYVHETERLENWTDEELIREKASIEKQLKEIELK